MTDADALLAAVCAEPDDDTPRLVFADYLDEAGEPERAAFIRVQIALARTAPWEPFAVHHRWHRSEWVGGRPFRHTLPLLPAPHLEWPQAPFRRGFGWALWVRSLPAWEQFSPGWVGRVPLGELCLWGAATLDDWRRFADSPLIPRLRRLRFVDNPIEPLLVLRDHPAALGLTDLFFDRSSGAGMPVVVEDLLAAPLGRTIRGLHFDVGYTSVRGLVEALNSGAPRLERLSLTNLGLDETALAELVAGPVFSGLRELTLSKNPLGPPGVGRVLNHLPDHLHTLILDRVGWEAPLPPLRPRGATGRGLRRLDVSHNPRLGDSLRFLDDTLDMSGLRSLALRGSHLGPDVLRDMVRSRFWPGLVELDLRDVTLDLAALRVLLDAPPPENLTALVLSADRLALSARSRLRRKFGRRVVFA